MSATNSLHYKLCCLGAKWMQKQDYGSYKYITVELVCIGAENPDVWGTNGYNSMLIEVKTSRADFLKDKKKFVRQEQNSKYATGNYRFYLAPQCIISESELPQNWGLIEYDPETESLTTVKYASPIITENHGELAILCSIMRRENIKKQIFNYRKS